MEIKDSGNRREFKTGAVRDICEGKGRCDLLPVEIIGKYGKDVVLENVGAFIYDGNAEHLWNALNVFSLKNYKTLPNSFLEVAKHYEQGCQKYGERNWEKGINIHCYIDSGVRHYLKFLRGDTDEPHDRAFIWNMLGAIWTLDRFPELNDLPCGRKETK